MGGIASEGKYNEKTGKMEVKYAVLEVELVDFSEKSMNLGVVIRTIENALYKAGYMVKCGEVNVSLVENGWMEKPKEDE